MTDLADVTVHIDENIDHGQRESLTDKVRGLSGVAAAALHDEKPHLMLVEYDPKSTDSAAILECVRSGGMHAKLIGL